MSEARALTNSRHAIATMVIGHWVREVSRDVPTDTEIRLEMVRLRGRT